MAQDTVRSQLNVVTLDSNKKDLVSCIVLNAFLVSFCYRPTFCACSHNKLSPILALTKIKHFSSKIHKTQKAGSWSGHECVHIKVNKKVHMIHLIVVNTIALVYYTLLLWSVSVYGKYMFSLKWDCFIVSFCIMQLCAIVWIK